MTMQEFIEKKMQEILATYIAKSEHYDGFENFRIGASLLRKGNDVSGMFEAAKAYQAKHIAYVFSHRLENVSYDEWSESLGDIINYCFIMLFFAKRYNDELDTKRAALYNVCTTPCSNSTDGNKGGN